MKNHQRGSMLVGIIIGIVIGLAVALLVAVYVTKVPVPFMNKSTARTPEQDAAETRKNQNWDPNAPLHGKNPSRPMPAAPGVNKSQQPAQSDKANGDKNAADKPADKAGSAPAVPSAPVAKAPVKAPSGDPLGDLAAAKAGSDNELFVYFVQAGAFRSPDEAEAQRAKLSLMGIEAKITEREQAGRQLYRVRIGPFEKKDEADRQKEKLDAGGFETAMVRVQR